MNENSKIEQSVANEIIERTLQFGEAEMYRQYDVMASHASSIDNHTNEIIEHITDEMRDEVTVTTLLLL